MIYIGTAYLLVQAHLIIYMNAAWKSSFALILPQEQMEEIKQRLVENYETQLIWMTLTILIIVVFTEIRTKNKIKQRNEYE